jgi:hypothetical protein
MKKRKQNDRSGKAGVPTTSARRRGTLRDMEVADRDQEKVKGSAKGGGDRKSPIKY